MARDRTTLYVSVALLLTVVVYLLSPPFTFYLAIQFGGDSWFMRATEIFYAPALWLSDHCPPYEHLLNALLRRLGIYFKI